MDTIDAVKVLVVGDKSVGKTSFVQRFAEDKYSVDVHSSVCVNYFYRRLYIDDKELMVNIFDAPSAEDYRKLTSLYFNAVQGIIVVYDINNISSCVGVSRWLVDIKPEIERDTVIILVANKCDLNTTEGGYEKEIISKMAAENDLNVINVSCKSGENVENAFCSLISEIAERKIQRRENEKFELENHDKNLQKATHKHNIGTTLMKIIRKVLK